jgi:hypothetical protein
MTEVPKIVYDRLRAAQSLPYGLPEQTHPDADLLTAFTERSLSATERDGMLHHLAICVDCREIVALALPAAEIPALPKSPDTEALQPQSSAERQARWTAGRLASMKPAWLKFGALNLGSKFGSGSGSGLRWAALAAGVVVAASVLALYPGKSSRPVATNTRPANAQIASSNPPESTAAPAPATSLETAKSGEGQRPAGLQRSASPKSGEIAADRRLDASTRQSANFPAVPAPEVTSEISTVGTLMARNEAPAIEKAKPALQSTEAQLANSDDRKDDQYRYTDNVRPGNELKKQLQERDTTSPSTSAPSALASTRTMSAAKMAPVVNGLVQHDAHWTITGGALLRSPDGGQSWQDSLRASHPLLCYASHGEDIWAGGQAGTLFHSTNSGATWVQVQPSINRQQLSSDITHIDLQGDLAATAKIAISTGSQEMWISADGGKTWEKK